MILILILCPLVSTDQMWNQQIQPDCDGDFAQMAIGLVQAKIEDPNKLQHIQAILSSCNKAMLQKMTEVSVFLLRKGILPSQILGEVKDLAETIRNQKDKNMENLINQAEKKLRKPLSEIAAISRNKSLSGNEKVQAIDVVLRSLDHGERNAVLDILNRQDTLLSAANSLPILNGSPIEPSNQIGQKPQEFKKTVEEIVTTPASFEIRPEGADNSSRPFKASEIKPSALNPAVAVGSSNVVHLPTFQFEKKETLEKRTGPVLIRPQIATTHKKQDIGERIFSSEPKAQPLSQSVPEPIQRQNSMFGESIAPSIFNQGRPHSVGKVESEEIPNIDDADLLKARPSFWRDAVKFLEQSTNIPAEIKKMLEGNMLRNGVVKDNTWNQSPFAANSFPLPQEAYDALKKQIETIPRIQSRSAPSPFLPSRDDPIVPVNSGGLERYETNLGRFEKPGNGNRFTISGAPLQSLPPLGVAGMQSQGQSATNQDRSPVLSGQPSSGPVQNTNRRLDGRPQVPLSPGIVNFNLRPNPLPPATETRLDNEGQASSFTYGNREEPSVIENQGVNKQEVQQWIRNVGPGADSFDKVDQVQYPTYPPAPPQLPATTTSPPIGPIPLSDRDADAQFPDFPSIGLGSGIPDLKPYIGPEEITGSRLQEQERYNLRQNGQNKFVKIDLLHN